MLHVPFGPQWQVQLVVLKLVLEVDNRPQGPDFVAVLNDWIIDFVAALNDWIIIAFVFCIRVCEGPNPLTSVLETPSPCHVRKNVYRLLVEFPLSNMLVSSNQPVLDQFQLPLRHGNSIACGPTACTALTKTQIISENVTFEAL